MSPAVAFVGLGSNLGDRRRAIASALSALERRPGIAVRAVSSIWETTPVGGPEPQEDYFNAAATIDTIHGPRELLEALLATERALGRHRRLTERWGPRTIDLDLLLYGTGPGGERQVVADEPGLRVPHPRMHERLFVLMPLAEVAATIVHPILGLTIAELRDRRQRHEGVAAAAPLVREVTQDL
jgi:2-amino-4-hydroxy-6-hydroxymethyldihydropteridine diphosphokinase